jgi:GrpB-like predicted nucleotidyltransferase (UPF0157 family)
MQPIIVSAHDPGWSQAFEQLRARVWPVVSDVALALEHVGSTSVPGLAAKPVIDADLVVRSAADMPVAIERLATLGYVHLGDLGIEGREAFESPAGFAEHHLYACPRDNLGLANHLAVRDYLRSHPDAVREYGELKLRLAREFPHDIDGYIAGKTGFLIGILVAAGFTCEQLDAIDRANQKPS